jgi:hypothetical protein
MVNKGLRRFPDRAKIAEVKGQYLRPENLPNLVVPAMNEGIFQDPPFRATELVVKNVQTVSRSPLSLGSIIECEHLCLLMHDC